MYNLIRSNFYRLFQRKSNFVILGVCFLLGLLIAILYATSSVMIFDLSTIFVAVVVPSFIGLNYSNGLIRNKLMAGNSRMQVYFSELITACIIGGVLWLVYQVPSVVITALMGTLEGALPAWQLGVFLPVGLVSVLGFCSLFCFIAMTMQSGRATVVCLIVDFIYIMLSALATVAINGVLPAAIAEIVICIIRLLPPQLFLGYAGAGWQVALYVIGGIAIGIVTSAIGIAIGKKANYK